jgi:beta-galactosidase
MSFFAYGGDFGEPRGTHGGNFVCDGLLFPDRTPSPALYDIKAIIQPVVFATSGDKLSIQSKYDFRDLSHLKFTWKLERLGLAIADGEFDIPLVTPHETVVVDLPSALTTAAQEDTWWTVSAVTRGELWAEDGHEVAWAQYMLPHEQVTPSSQPEPEPTIVGERIIVGPASFDLKTGDMMTLGSIGAREARVDLWRAPTDNDSGGEMDADWPELRTSNLDRWLDAGLDRVQHHVDSMDLDSGRLVVRSRIGPAVLDRYLDTVTTYESLNGGLSLQVELSINPVGPWTGFALPRLGFCLVLDTATLSNVKWFGLGPGESYPDTKSGVRMGVYEQSVDDMQTPYVMPQENGNRMGVRFAEILDSAGAGLRIDGRPDFNFTVRRWTSEDLHKARRLTDLKAREVLVLNIDIVNSGVGSASTGPGVLDKHRLLLQEGEPVTFTFVLHPVEQV